MFLLALVLMQIPPANHVRPPRVADRQANSTKLATTAPVVEKQAPVENNVQDTTKDEKIDLLQLQLQIAEEQVRQLDFAAKAEQQKDAAKESVDGYNAYVQKLVTKYKLGPDAHMTQNLQFISPPKDPTPKKP